jgi:hypothetical protein
LVIILIILPFYFNKKFKLPQPIHSWPTQRITHIPHPGPYKSTQIYISTKYLRPSLQCSGQNAQIY